MKNLYVWLFMAIFPLVMKAQEPATFEDLPIGPAGIWNGSDGAAGFSNGSYRFLNTYNTEYQSWSGFAYTNHTDTVTRGYDNQYSAIVGSGVEGSTIYTVAYTMYGATIMFDEPHAVSGLYATNSTYAYWSMAEGDDFSKKFGGASGADPDFFRLLITGYDADGDSVGRVIFYLADFRSENSADHFIVDDWKWVDLSPLGELGSLKFSLESSDVGSWGMNTPGYFCIDNVGLKSTATPTAPIAQVLTGPQIWPNPVTDRLQIALSEGVYVLQINNMQGQKIWQETVGGGRTHTVGHVALLPAGVYLLNVTNEHLQRQTFRVVKR